LATLNYELYTICDIEIKHTKCSSEQEVSHRINSLLIIHTKGIKISTEKAHWHTTTTLVLTCTSHLVPEVFYLFRDFPLF
jgi:hypothetical protein